MTVESSDGVFTGQQKNSSYSFQNIPYALPPINELRWKAPRPVNTKTTNKIGSEIKCAQLGGFFSGSSIDQFNTPVGSEDCLYLNISTPENFLTQKKKPVFLWLFGGSNRAGYASDPLYQGENLANATDAVIVTINYRLGHFGAFYNKIMHNGDKADDSGNYVTLDTIMALDWVIKNIESFGGDPKNITVGGQSAGCINLWGLIMSPLAKDKFQRAYCSAGIPNNYPTQIAEQVSTDFIANVMVEKKLVETKSHARKVMNKVNPKLLQKLLRSLSTEEVLNIPFSGPPIHHISDGHVFSSLGLASILAGKVNKVDLMLGANALEASYFAQFFYLDASKEHFWQMINGQANLMPFYETIQSRNFDNFMKISLATTKLFSESIDYILHSTQLYFPNIYRYEFSWKSSFEPWRTMYGSTHGLELPFLFRNFEYGEEHFLNILKEDFQLKRSDELSNAYSRYIKGFLHSGNPNQFLNDNHQQWKPWKSATLKPYRLIFGESDEQLKKVFPNVLIGLETLKIAGNILTHSFDYRLED